jgi:hypothetical protein
MILPRFSWLVDNAIRYIPAEAFCDLQLLALFDRLVFFPDCIKYTALIPYNNYTSWIYQTHPYGLRVQ